jgi:hypothetical protein
MKSRIQESEFRSQKKERESVKVVCGLIILDSDS